METGKWLIYAGILLIAAGVIWIVLEKLGLTPGKLPGDIVIKKENTTFYFPIVTSIVLSVILSLLFFLFRR